MISEQGGSRSSKTYNTLVWICVYCLRNSDTTVSVVRATLPALKASVLRDFLHIMQTLGVLQYCSFNKSNLFCEFPNGSWIEFFSSDSEQKLRGRKRKILFVNEANELKFIQWQQLKLRTTELSIIDYNPSFSDDHWINKLNKESTTYYFITTYKDNPFLEDVVIKEIESLKTRNYSLWQIYGLGQQAIVEGLVFRNIEVVEEFPQTSYKRRQFVGMDFGYTNDPTAIVLVSIEEETKSMYVEEICYKTEMLTNDIIHTLKPYKSEKIISESADPRLVQEIYRAGINIHPVVKYQGSVEAGLAKMQEYKIIISKRSTNVVKEFRNYTYQQDKDGKWLNKPIDIWNHAIDAIRYVVMNEVLGGRCVPIDKRKVYKLAY